MSTVIYLVNTKIRYIFTNSMRKDLLFKFLLYRLTQECQQNRWDCKQNSWDWRKNCMDWQAISNIPSSSLIWGMTHQILTQFLLVDVLYGGDLRRYQGLARRLWTESVQTFHFFQTEKPIFPRVHFPDAGGFPSGISPPFAIGGEKGGFGAFLKNPGKIGLLSFGVRRPIPTLPGP